MRAPPALLPILLVLLTVPWVGLNNVSPLFGALLVIQSCQANNSLPVFKTKACCYSISGVPDTSLPPGAGLPQQDDLLEGGQDDHQDDHLDGDHSSSHDSQKIST